MTKVAIENENITSFDGIYHIMDVFSKLGFEKLILLSAKHSVLHPNSLPHCSLDDFMLVTSPLFVFCYPWR